MSKKYEVRFQGMMMGRYETREEAQAALAEIERKVQVREANWRANQRRMVAERGA